MASVAGSPAGTSCLAFLCKGFGFCGIGVAEGGAAFWDEAGGADFSRIIGLYCIIAGIRWRWELWTCPVTTGVPVFCAAGWLLSIRMVTLAGAA